MNLSVKWFYVQVLHNLPGAPAMEFSWTIFLTVICVNALYIKFMFFLQDADKTLPARGSIIPGTNQKFLYVQDFYSCTWGDFFGVPLIANAFVHLSANGYINNHRQWQQIQWATFVIIALVDGAGFLIMCLGENHKPDQGYPKIGRVSPHGLSHLPYHGIGVAMSALVIWHIIIGNLCGPVLYVALAGALIYIASFICDVKAGNFDPLKRI